MEIDNDVFILWDVFDRLFVPHVFFGTILSHARRGGFPRSNRPLRNDDPIRSNLHDGSRTLRLRAFPRQFPLLHDGIRLGTTQRGHAHVLPRRIHVQRSIPTVGHVGILHAVGTFGND